MSVSRTGNVTAIQSTDQSNSQSVTVPTDAKLAIVVATGYDTNQGDFFTGGTAEDSGTANLTLGGTNMKVGTSGEEISPDSEKSAIFYLANPSTGSKTLAWDWEGVPEAGVNIFVVFYKGIDTNDPIRDRGSDQEVDTDAATGTLTAVSGDMIAAGAGFYTEFGAGGIDWTNATELDENVIFEDVSAYAEASPSGNVVITATGTGDSIAPSIVALVMRQSATEWTTHTHSTIVFS